MIHLLLNMCCKMHGDINVKCMEILRLVRMRRKETSPPTCFHVNMWLSMEQRRGVSDKEAWEIWDEAKEEENSFISWKKKKRSMQSLSALMQIYMGFALKREDSWAECTGVGENIVPPFLLLPTEQLCSSPGGWRVWKKGKEGRWYSHITACAFYLKYWCLDSDWQPSSFLSEFYCLSDGECEVSLSISPFSWWLTVTLTPSLLSARLHLY